MPHKPKEIICLFFASEANAVFTGKSLCIVDVWPTGALAMHGLWHSLGYSGLHQEKHQCALPHLHATVTIRAMPEKTLSKQ